MRDLSGWIDFFTSAGVPPMVRKTYAQIFVDHRITDSIVSDLEKEHLKDMGIVVIGDIIAILKQCKKVGHEDPSVNAPKVSSSVDCANVTIRASPPAEVSSQVPFSPKPCRRVTPEMEGKYIVKQPAGTTPRTRQILAALKQRATSTTDSPSSTVPLVRKAVVQRKQSQPQERKSTSFLGDGDLDEGDNYRVILSKKSNDSALPGSVFSRLGGLTLASGSQISSSQEIAAGRRMNLDIGSESTSAMVIRRPDIVSSSLPGPTVPQRSTGRLHFADSNPALTVKTAGKRQSSSSVFSRLSEHDPPSKRAHVGVKGNDINSARVQTVVSKNWRQQQQHASNLQSSTYTEGVLGTSTSLSLSKTTIKSRLGNPSVANVRKSNGLSVHSRLGALK